jgi:hypothetical protein
MAGAQSVLNEYDGVVGRKAVSIRPMRLLFVPLPRLGKGNDINRVDFARLPPALPMSS